MKQITLFLVLLIALTVGVKTARGAQMDIVAKLMHTTFKIAGKSTLGTAFILGRPASDDTRKLFYILVTAAHVLRDIKEEQATIFLRRKHKDEFIKFPYSIKIRDGEKKLWEEHPKADVAVMYVELPPEANVVPLPMKMLATDADLKEIEMHPGDILSCLGYPFGAEANKAGFPILRSGQIASYPLTPTKKVMTFLYDFEVFGGNSGGPVCFIETNRIYGGLARVGEVLQFIVGLVSEQKVIEEEVRSLTEIRKTKHPLALAVVVHADLIQETIELLPLPSEK